jgi:hypothetical protein
MTEEVLRSARMQDDPAVFRTEVLCQHVPSMHGIVRMTAWAAAADDTANMSGLLSQLVLCVDVADDLGHVTLLAGAPLDEERVQVEVVEVWPSTDAARQDLDGWKRLLRPKAFGWFPAGPAAAMSPELERLCDTPLGAADEPVVCSGLAEQIVFHRVVHNGDGLLERHLRSVQREDVGAKWRFRRKGAAHIDAAYALAGVVHLARGLRNRPTPRARWV